MAPTSLTTSNSFFLFSFICWLFCNEEGKIVEEGHEIVTLTLNHRDRKQFQDQLIKEKRLQNKMYTTKDTKKPELLEKKLLFSFWNE